MSEACAEFVKKMSRPSCDGTPGRPAKQAYFFVLCSRGLSLLDPSGSASRGLPLEVFHIQSLAAGVGDAFFVTRGVAWAAGAESDLESVSSASGLLQPTKAMTTRRQIGIFFMEETRRWEGGATQNSRPKAVCIR